MWTLVSDDGNGNMVIQVTGCAKQTYVAYGLGDDKNALADSVAQDVLINMNPSSPTYDPTLVSS